MEDTDEDLSLPQQKEYAENAVPNIKEGRDTALEENDDTLGAVGGIPEQIEEDFGKGARRKTMTTKGKEYQIDRLRHKTKSALLTFHKHVSKLHGIVLERNYSEMEMQKSKLESHFASFTEAHQSLVSQLDELSEIEQANQAFTQALNSFNQTMSAVSLSLKRMECEENDSISLGGSASRYSKNTKVSRSSSGSTRFSRSQASIKLLRSEAAASKAAYEAELRFFQAESELKEKENRLKSEEAKLTLQKEKAKAEARELALSQFQEADVKSKIAPPVIGKPVFPQVSREEPVSVPFMSEIQEPSKVVARTSQWDQPFLPGDSAIQTRNEQNFPEARDTTRVPLHHSQGPLRGQSYRPPHQRVVLPAEEPNIFDGTCVLDYPIWKGRFKELIEEHVPEPSRRIGYLIKYTRGEAREAIEGYVIDATDESYFEAMNTLDRWYGDQLTISKEYKRKLKNWPVLSTQDGGKDLRKFSNFLNSCKRLIPDQKHQSSLDDEELNQTLVLKLPRSSREVWSRKVYAYKEEQKQKEMNAWQRGFTLYHKPPSFPPFAMFSEHVQQEALIATQPVVGTAVLDQIVAQNKKTNSHQARSRNYKAIRSFATSTGNQDKDQAPRTENKSTPSCLCCKQSHTLDECSVFKFKQYDSKVEFVKENKLCFRCLKVGHISRKCLHPLTCSLCGKSHPTVMHSETPIKSSGVSRNLRSENPSNASKDDSSVTEAKSTTCMMATTHDFVRTTRVVPVFVRHAKNPNKELKVYCALDEQSDSCFIADQVREILGIEAPQVTIRITCMGTSSTVTCFKIKDLSVRSFDGNILKLPACYTRGSIPVNSDQIVSKQIATEHPRYKEILHEIPDFDPSVKVGLLLGTSCVKAMKPIQVISDSDSDSYAVKTVLGWSIVRLPSRPVSESEMFCNRIESAEIKGSNVVPLSQTKEMILQDAFMESIELDFSEYKTRRNMLLGNADRPISIEDKRFLQKCEESIKHNEDGHYELSLPFRNDNPMITDNRPMAVQRLKGIKKRMDHDERYKKDYFEFIRKLLQKNLAVKVDKNDQGLPGKKWYLIHHGVYHPLKPGKIRVVYDGSAKYQGVSLNDLLLPGPCLTNTLIGVLLRFRKGKFCWIADLEQMFYSVYLTPEHQDFFRFLFWEDENTDDDPVEYKMRVHSFGISSSPGCSIFALKKTAEDNRIEFGDETAEVLCCNSYVDDILVSCDSVEEAVSLANTSKAVCKKGGFKLTKFAANDSRILNKIPVEERCSEVKDLDIGCNNLPILRTLGVEWSIEHDSFMFRITLKDRPFTRRGILATVSSIFDPLGYICCVTVEAKRILQTLVKDSQDWDEEVPESLRPRWEKWRSKLPGLAMLKIKRCFKPDEFGEVEKIELHHFNDASSYAYGQCSYLRITDNQGQIHCSLVMAKARIAPLRPVTIPRMELTAALVSVRVAAMLQEELKYQNMTHTYWTDSKVILGYISNDSKRFHVYVANRVQEIREKSCPKDWLFVSTNDNPADDVSRGLRCCDLNEDCRFFKGPEFLWHRLPQELQDSNDFNVLEEADPEVKRCTVLSIETKERFPSLFERILRFSRFHKDLKFLAILKKFLDYLKNKVNPKIFDSSTKSKLSNSVMVEDLNLARIWIIKAAQGDAFHDEILVLKEIISQGEESERQLIRRKNSKLKKTSSLFRLQPFLDKNGILRVGGRLHFSSLPEELKHPVIMPKSHHITKILIRDIHEKMHHQGRGITHNAVREAGYWIIGGTSAVSNCISDCTVCKRLRGHILDQKMADLPPERSESAPPFTYVGVDFFGPWLIKIGRKELKRYGVLFTCLASRGIRIEVAPSLETDSFINAVRRFVCRNGSIRQLRCDRGSNMIGASREIREGYQSINHKKVNEFLLQRSCDYFPFVFNVPSASYQGGVWERQIRSVRAVLNPLLLKNGQQLDEDSLHTFMAEVEAVVNCRPLTVDNLANVDGPLPLTANNILTGKSKLTLPPPGIFEKPDLYVKKRWRRVQHLANEFWQRWRKEFLQSLQERTKWNTVRRDLKINDIVIIADDSMPRNCWKLARVVKLYPDADGHVRRVRCQVGDSSLDAKGMRTKDNLFLDRPIQKLVLFLKSDDSGDGFSTRSHSN